MAFKKFTLINYQQYILFSLLSFFVYFAFFYGIAAYPIVDINEGLYAEVAREMLENSNYIIPHLNYVPYIEKPPLLYWLITLAYHFFGVTTFSARLVPSIASAFVCFTLYFFGKSLHKQQTGWLAAIILATSIGFMIIGRVIFFDMLLTASMTLALCLFYIWYEKEKSSYLYLAYSFLAMAALTKGFVAIILSSTIAFLFLLIKTSLPKIKQFFNPIGIGIFLLIIIPWHLIAMLKMPGFAWDYFINEQIYRFLNKRVPNDYHSGPIYYYIPRLFVYLFPWSIFLPALLKNIRGKLSKHDSLKLFLWIWFLVPFIFFSLSGAKGDYYMVIATPPLAFLLGIKLTNYIQNNQYKLLRFLFISLAVLLTVATLYFLSSPTLPQQMFTSTFYLLKSLLIYFGIGILIQQIYKKSMFNFLLLAGFSIFLTIYYLHFKVIMSDKYSQYSIVEYIKHHDNRRKIYLYEDYDRISSILFFLERRLPVINNQSPDLYFGSQKKQAKGWFIDNYTFSKQLDQPVYVAILKYKYNAFEKNIPKFCIATENTTIYLLSNIQHDCKN